MRLWNGISIGCLLMAAPGPARAEHVRIVDSGRPAAVVVVPDDASEQVKAAAELLVRYVRESSGAALPVAPAAKAPTKGVRIQVGPSRPVDGLDDDGFVIRVGEQGLIAIAGPTDWGTEFGVVEFLERWVGVRWLLPGADGADVPAHKTIDVPTGEVRQAPVFFSRLFSGLRGGAQAEWARRNRMHGRVSFHHNLIKLFPPETYTKTHPEFFPIKGGKRFLPATNSTHAWQPCFSEPGTIAEAIRNINAAFDANPQTPSFSLGANDSSGYCACERCTAAEGKAKNFLGRRHMSDLYFGWCNQVIDGVLKKHPKKFFGCLAYSEVAQPPDHTRVHEKLIPYMTYDRMKWMHPELRAEGQKQTKLWHKVSPVVGWYDYIYGSPYCVPRVWFHHMADYYRFGRDNGVRALYAEAYPNWGEGPKLYVSLKLQWNPDRNVDELLDDWFKRVVGPEAAPELAAYYAHWEDFWTRRVLDSKWFSKGGQYLAFYSPGYLDDVTPEDMAKSRAWLEATVAKARTAKQKARAKLLLRAFEYYEASVLAFSAEAAGVPLPPKTEADALRLIEQGQRMMAASRKRTQLAEKEFADHPVLVHPLPPSRFPRLSAGEAGGGVWRWLYAWALKSRRVRDRLEQAVKASDAPELKSLAHALLFLASDQRPKPLSANPSFEGGKGGLGAGWGTWIKWGKGSMRRVKAAARTGAAGVLCKGIKRGGPLQSIKVTPGRYAAVAYVRVPKAVEPGATIELCMTRRNAKGGNLPTPSTLVAAEPGGWQPLALVVDVPPTLKGKPVASVLFLIILNGFAPEDAVHVDDMAMYRLGDPAP